MDPANPAVHQALGRLALKRGALLTAHGSLKRVVDLSPGDAVAVAELAHLSAALYGGDSGLQVLQAAQGGASAARTARASANGTHGVR